jgi:hypothetical protein
MFDCYYFTRNEHHHGVDTDGFVDLALVKKIIVCTDRASAFVATRRSK